MSYYLPIMINSRRLHVCHLRQKSVNEPLSNYWGFIIHTEKSQTLFSVENQMPKLIAKDGVHKDLGHKWTFVVRSSDESVGGYDTYRVRITDDPEQKKLHEASCGLVVSGRMTDDIHPITVTADLTVMDASRPVSIVLEYECDGKIYEDSFRLYFCTDERKNGVAVALDFGSEASQARFSKVDGNMPLVEGFERMLGLQGGSAGKGSEYWQGKPADDLFKSVFWVRHNPRQVTNYGDRPMKVADAPFISPLMSATEESSVYADMELLPNLKLVELSQGGGYIAYGLKPIVFPDGSDIDFQQANLADQGMRESVLRIILGNFLHAILAEVDRSSKEKYLRLVVMAPNVYYQNKVFAMMQGLYLDFDLIKKRGLYPMCKGLEVQVVSESDAAFIGARICRRNSIVNASDGFFLNIDSGKGTTDFSILKQQKNFSKFTSLYRDGMPAAGNVITYAFYEALHDFMMAHGIDIHPFFANASKAALIDFMSYLEELKKQDVPGAEPEYFTVPKKTDLNDITALVKYLSNNRGRTIPGLRGYVDAKLTVLVDCLRESIGHYMQMGQCVFTQVILSGRALLYHPFKERLIKMLCAENWIASESDVVWIDGDLAKTCCLMGALAVEGECDVNYNSGLIGSPLLTRAEDRNEGWFTRMVARLFNSVNRHRYTGIDSDFFYSGSKGLASRNVTLRLGGRAHLIPSPDPEEKKIFFLGGTFASQVGDGGLNFIESNDLTFDNPVFRELVSQSLFPYYQGSVGRPLNQYFDESTREIMLEQAATAPARTSTAVTRTSGNPINDVDA